MTSDLCENYTEVSFGCEYNMCQMSHGSINRSRDTDLGRWTHSEEGNPCNKAMISNKVLLRVIDCIPSVKTQHSVGVWEE